MKKRKKLGELLAFLDSVCEDDDLDEEEEQDWGAIQQQIMEERVLSKPVGCRACGGDYPNCKSSCPMFDD